MNFYPFHIGDYLVHTRHLTLMEDLAYRRTLDLYYTRDGSIPSAAADVARLIGMREQEAEVAAVLAEFFPEGCNKRADEELAKMRAKQDNARASVAKRSHHASVTQASREHHAIQQTNTNTNTKEREPRATRLASPFVLEKGWREWALTERPDLDPDLTAAKFADFWHSKPGKDGRKLDWLATWRNWVREERAPKINPADVARQTVHIPPKPSTWLAEQEAHKRLVEAERLARKTRETA